MKIFKNVLSTLIFALSIMLIGNGLISIAFDSTGTPSAPMAGEPEITLTIEQEIVKVRVDPNSDGIAILSGEVTCEMPPYIPNNVFCVVYLRADAGGWPVSVPPELSFSNSVVSNRFSISVQVPLGSLVTESRDVFISGTWEYVPGNQGGTVNSDSAYLEVQPYSFLEISNSEYNVSLSSGSSKTISASIINTGNAKAEIDVGAISDDPAIRAEVKDGEYSLSPNQKVEVKVKIEDTKDQNGIYRVTLWAQEKEFSDQGRVTRDFTVSVRKEPFSLFNIPYIIPVGVILVLASLTVGGFIFLRKRRGRWEGEESDVDIEI